MLVFLSRGTAAPMPPLPGSLYLLQRLTQPLRLLLWYLPLCGPLTGHQDVGWASVGWFQTPQQRPLLGPHGEPPTEPGIWGNRTDRPSMQPAAASPVTLCYTSHPHSGSLSGSSSPKDNWSWQVGGGIRGKDFYPAKLSRGAGAGSAEPRQLRWVPWGQVLRGLAGCRTETELV